MGTTMKLLNKICQIIIKKKEVNKAPLITNKKDANKVQRNRYGFPVHEKQ